MRYISTAGYISTTIISINNLNISPGHHQATVTVQQRAVSILTVDYVIYL